MLFKNNGRNDELGTPDECLAKCSCGVIFRKGSWHRCDDTGEKIPWEEFDG